MNKNFKAEAKNSYNLVGEDLPKTKWDVLFAKSRNSVADRIEFLSYSLNLVYEKYLETEDEFYAEEIERLETEISVY